MVKRFLDWLKERLSQMAYGKMPTGKFDSRVVIEIKNESLLNDDWIEIPESITYRVVDSKGKELIKYKPKRSYALVGSKLKGIQTKLKPKHLRLIFNALDFANIFSSIFSLFYNNSCRLDGLGGNKEKGSTKEPFFYLVFLSRTR